MSSTRSASGMAKQWCLTRRAAVARFPCALMPAKNILLAARCRTRTSRQLYACEISEYAGPFDIVNLATRDLIDGENFPLVARADFFDTRPRKTILYRA